MLEKLKGIEEHYEDVQAQLADPAVYADSDLLRRLSREQKELEPIVEAYRAYRKWEADEAAARELLSDQELKEMAQEEFHTARAELERLREELKILLLPRDPNDDRDVIMEVRGGVGGEEGMLFAGDLMRMYTMYAESKGWKVDVVNCSETELGGVKEASFVIEG